MRKGFTLFELLAVIVLLGIITAIATPIIFNVIEDGKKAALESTIDNIERASYTYITEENLGYEEYYQKITLEELANSGYLKDFDNKNPVTGNTLEGCIIYRWNGNKYEYNYVEPCEVPLMPGPLINILIARAGREKRF